MRRLLILCIAASLLAAAQTRGDSTTTRPTVSVAVVAFDVLGPAGREWLGRAIQEGLATGLQKSPGCSGIIVAGLPPADAPAAISMAGASGADAVIFGAIQVIDDQIRVTGQIISTRTGQSLGSLVSDGAARDIFNIEDILTDRCQRILISTSRPKGTPPLAARPTLDLVGPTIGPGPSRYFDGNLMSQITPPPRFQDEYDRYNYQTAATAGFGCVYTTPGYAWCYGGNGGWGCGGGMVYPVAAPISGW